MQNHNSPSQQELIHETNTTIDAEHPIFECFNLSEQINSSNKFFATEAPYGASSGKIEYQSSPRNAQTWFFWTTLLTY